MMKIDGEAAKLWDVNELQWFFMKCWDLALKHIDDWGFSKVSHLAQAAVKVFLSNLLIFAQPLIY